MARHVHSLKCIPICSVTGRTLGTPSLLQGIRPGMRFRWVYADSNPEWVVLRRRTGDVWLAEVAPESDDGAGTQQIFTAAQIRASMKYQAASKKGRDDMESWYASLREGQIVHYNNGFGEYVRSKISMDSSGKHVLLPIALVGAWRVHDLLRSSYYPMKIAERVKFKPNWTTIYESPSYAYPPERSPDPTHMPPINLQGPRS